MQVHFELNGKPVSLETSAGEPLLELLRRNRIWSLKHGCETGECGACSVLLDGRLLPTCIILASEVEGRKVQTVESLTERQEVHPIQQAFVETGAIQCGFCTPAMVLATLDLLNRDPDPTEEAAREALSGVLCRCTGYVKPLEAVMRAAAYLRGEEVPPIVGEGIPIEFEFPPEEDSEETSMPDPEMTPDMQVMTETRLKVAAPPATGRSRVVAHPEPKVDAEKLVKGLPAFVDDIELPGLLYAEMLTSPHAHARIKDIDTTKAEALPGVHAVLTHKNTPRVIYASGGQSHPNPPPWDQVSLDSKVRHVGDRVAVLAAETPEIAREAVDLIEVEYELLEPVFDPELAMAEGAPVIHDEEDAVAIADRNHNLAAIIKAEAGDVEAALKTADLQFERTYRVHQVQQGHIEPHICITYWDEDQRLVVRTSTQVPFHVRRMLAPLIGLQEKDIRVIKPRIGGGFGGKQEMLIEDLCAHLTIATGRPVRMEYTREMEFTSSRSRHPQILRYRAGVDRDGSLRALDLHVISNTGAYGTHGLTVCSVTGTRGLATYQADAVRFRGDVVYTNIPTPGAYRGYGAPQAEFALESLMEEIAVELDLDPLEFRLKNVIPVGGDIPITAALGEGEHVSAQVVTSSSLPQCVSQGAAAAEWDRRHQEGWQSDPDRPHIRRGLGFAVAMHATGIPGLDMGGAIIKMNDDGSFNLLIGATDLGTGSDTILAQIAAETLGVPLEDIIVYSSDTDFTPFDVGAYASSTTYISGGAVKKAAEGVRKQIFERAALMLGVGEKGMWLEGQAVHTPEGQQVTLREVALHSLHAEDQQQIMANASHMSDVSPQPYAGQFAEVEVDVETGQVTVVKLVMAVDCGTPINPQGASGQVEGGLVQALGYAVSEAMVYDDRGKVITTRFGDYRIFQADEVPIIQAILVPSYEEHGPFGAKAVAEIPMDGVAPAVANAIFHATGKRLRELPFFPETVWRALQLDHPA